LSPDFSCALLPMVSSPFSSPWGVDNFRILSRLCRAVALVLGDWYFSLKWSCFGFCSTFDHLFEFFIHFISFSLFLWIVYYVCCQCTHQGGDWGPVDGRSWLWWVLDNVVWTNS
jgi:hypothetical protein